MKRHESRNISRSRNRVEALSPCTSYSNSGGVNPFAMILQRAGILKQLEGKTQEQAEKEVQHELKMAADQKSAKARAQRKRNKV